MWNLEDLSYVGREEGKEGRKERGKEEVYGKQDRGRCIVHKTIYDIKNSKTFLMEYLN